MFVNDHQIRNLKEFFVYAFLKLKKNARIFKMAFANSLSGKSCVFYYARPSTMIITVSLHAGVIE
jgi:hypothetical protein